MNIAELAAWISRQRQEQKMTRADLAYLVAEQPHLIADIERLRRTDPGVITLHRIARALGYELSFTVTKRIR